MREGAPTTASKLSETGGTSDCVGSMAGMGGRGEISRSWRRTPSLGHLEIPSGKFTPHRGQERMNTADQAANDRRAPFRHQTVADLTLDSRPRQFVNYWVDLDRSRVPAPRSYRSSVRARIASMQAVLTCATSSGSFTLSRSSGITVGEPHVASAEAVAARMSRLGWDNMEVM